MPDTIIECALTGKLDAELLMKWLNDESVEDTPEDCILNCCNRNEFVAYFLSFLRNQTDRNHYILLKPWTHLYCIHNNFILFQLAGITIIVLASIVLGQLRNVQDILPINIIPISLIVLGCIIFIIAFLACCGAVRESRCMLISYSICMMVLAGVKIYLSVVVYEYLNVAQETVTNWLNTGFNNTSLRPAFHTMEALFRCCGTVGPSAYGSQPLPPTCCEVPQNTTCAAPDAFGGCNDRVTDYLETFGGAIGGVLLFVIIFEVVLIVLACFFQCRIAKK